MLFVFPRQPGALDDLHLVDLQDVERQGGDDGCLADAFLGVLSGQSDDDVASREDAPGVGAFHGGAAAGEVVAAVDAAQGLVVGALDAVFHEEEGLAVELLQIVEQLVAHAVGTGADDNAHHIGHCQCLLIHSPQFVHLGVCIRIGLEISQISHVWIFPREECLALLQLLRDRFPAVAIAGVERAVVAVSAAARGDFAVPVGTGEPCIYRDLLHPEGELTANPSAEIVVIPRHAL